MRILVDNSGYELYNFGDVAMLQVAVSRLAALWPDASIEVLTTRPERLERFCPQTLSLPGEGRRAFFAEGVLLPMKQPRLRRALNEVERGLRRRFPNAARRKIQRAAPNATRRQQIARFVQALRQADLCVASGGGYLTDAFPEHAHATLDTLWMAHRCGVPTALLGHGLGPIEGRNLRASVARTLPLIDVIGLREGLRGPQMCRELGVAPQRVHVNGDDAIELAYGLRSPANEPLGHALGVNVRVAQYSRVDDAMLHALRAALDEGARRWNVPTLGVPISTYEAESDLRSIDALLEGIFNAPTNSRDRGAQVQTPSDAIVQIGRCRVVVTGSYHAGLFALSQGVSVVGLAASDYYVDKFSGLQEQFGTGCHALRMNAPDFAAQLKATLQLAWNGAEAARPTLLEAARQQIESGHQTYDQLKKLVADAKSIPR